MPVAEQLHYPPPNPVSAVTSAEHLTEISLSCGGSYPPADLCFSFCGCFWLVPLPCWCSQWHRHRVGVGTSGLWGCGEPGVLGDVAHEYCLAVSAQALTVPSWLSCLHTSLSDIVSDIFYISLKKIKGFSLNPPYYFERGISEAKDFITFQRSIQLWSWRGHQLSVMGLELSGASQSPAWLLFSTYF